MARRGGFDSIGEDTHQRLREDILAGRLRPGTRLKVTALRAQLGVSASIVREALLRLAEQDLVTLEANHGFLVKRLSVESLGHIVEARLEVESFALRLAVERGATEWEAECIATHHLLHNVPRRLDSNEQNPLWPAAHRRFHMALYAGSGNPVVLGLCGAVFDRAELYRRWSTESPGARAVEDEHQGILDAAMASDGDAAVRLLRAHIQRTADRVLHTAIVDEEEASQC